MDTVLGRGVVGRVQAELSAAPASRPGRDRGLKCIVSGESQTWGSSSKRFDWANGRVNPPDGKKARRRPC